LKIDREEESRGSNSAFLIDKKQIGLRLKSAGIAIMRNPGRIFFVRQNFANCFASCSYFNASPRKT
jgi:hypothetical protein